MPLDRKQLTASLHRFYDFEGKVVLCVGAGSGQLLDPNIVTAQTILIDRDRHSLAGANRSSPTKAAQESRTTLVSDFGDVHIRGDVVYFEFCLHEMDDPQKTINHARTLASDVVVYEHAPSSEWVFHAVEEGGVCRAAQALSQFPIKCRQNVYAEQTFKDHAELVAKLSSQGDLAIERAIRFAGETDIVIPMKCTLVLL
jgi:hypothetical protein